MIWQTENGNDDFADLFNNEFKVLTDIGNKYRIRHHETDRIDITDVRYYDYFFQSLLIANCILLYNI